MDLFDVVTVRAIAPWRLLVAFDDGAAGEIDLDARLEWRGLFAELRLRPALFGQATVDPERRVVCWPNGADLDSDLLRAWLAGREVPEWASAVA